MKCNRCGKWAGAYALPAGAPTDHICMCQRTSSDAFLAIPGENEKLRALLARAVKQLQAWHVKYGENQPNWLPPSGDVKLMEDADALLSANA